MAVIHGFATCTCLGTAGPVCCLSPTLGVWSPHQPARLAHGRVTGVFPLPLLLLLLLLHVLPAFFVKPVCRAMYSLDDLLHDRHLRPLWSRMTRVRSHQSWYRRGLQGLLLNFSFLVLSKQRAARLTMWSGWPGGAHERFRCFRCFRGYRSCCCSCCCFYQLFFAFSFLLPLVKIRPITVFWRESKVFPPKTPQTLSTE